MLATLLKNDVNQIRLVVLAASLGYFVDIYDILIFTLVRVESLKSLHVLENGIETVGIHLLNLQLLGMAIGGILWGVLGDKFGRMKILYGSILLYSIATFANAFVGNIFQYEICRLFAGVGLAGELGLGVTLASEFMNSRRRGYGTMVIASVGCLGVILAAIIVQSMGWRNSYIFGGTIGLLVLCFRIVTNESPLYREVSASAMTGRGNLQMLWVKPGLARRYFLLILAGSAIYFVMTIFIFLAKELGEHYQLNTNAGMATLYFYAANAVSDILCPLLSQKLRSRKKALFLFLFVTLLSLFVFCFQRPSSTTEFYLRYSLCGLGIGCWATLLVTISESFGTNFRATATTSIPNFIRVMGIPILWLYVSFKGLGLETLESAFMVGCICIAVSMFAVSRIKESFNMDLNYTE